MVRLTQTNKPRALQSSGRITRQQSKKIRTSGSHRLSEQPTDLKTSPVEANSCGGLCDTKTLVQKDPQDNCFLSPNQNFGSQKQRFSSCGAILGKDNLGQFIQQPKPSFIKHPYGTILGEESRLGPPLERYSSDSETERRLDRPSDTPLGDLVPNLTFRKHSTSESQSNQSTSVTSTFDSVEKASQSSEMSLTKDITYRLYNLEHNNIYLLSHHAQLPEHIIILANEMGKDRGFSGPSTSDVWQDTELEALELNAGEALVQSYFQKKVFPFSAGTLLRSERSPLSKHVIPHNDQTDLMLSIPVPDLLFGYNHTEAFTEGQQVQISALNGYRAINCDMLLYPFFVVEFKADGPSGAGGLWAATNQCLGGSATCVNIAEQLNQHLRQFQSSGSRPIDSTVFSVAMSGTEARLYITWKYNDDGKYYTVKVKSFLLQMPKSYLDFQKYVLNIVDWGTARRLTQIREALDIHLEESRSRTSRDAKSHPPPSNFTSSSKRRKM